ncbi:hypothetical protein [Pseudoclavibacter sp. RFBB5]|uniref:hypothetical protein n=1 Tax=Pseudoclavibacter sp. RFBB5 TaxID=2080574 RepID=UPI000CE8DC12|nr:hypothetical protein [Pseudoclavibacter sp. RFBB5]PPG33090.1 hypothetical protein C5B97_00190 [Pseudoclavibacter sp. RFBB5]
MTFAAARLALVSALVAAALTLSGCTGTGTSGGSTPEAASPTPTIAEPPSTPIVEQTITDELTGTSVTTLAMVTDFESAANASVSDGLQAVLVKVRFTAGDEYGGAERPTLVSITDRDVNLDYVSLGLTNPETLAPAMTAAGYTPINSVQPGETVTGWVGAWLRDDYTQFDLVYDRGESTVFGGDQSGEKIPPFQQIVPLEPSA